MSAEALLSYVDGQAASVTLQARHQTKTVDLSGLGTVEPEPVQWIVPHSIPRGIVMAWNGDGGVGKTRLSLQLASAVAARMPFLGTVPDVQGPVCLISAEEDAASVFRIVSQIAKAESYRSADLEAIAANVHVFDITDAPVLFDGIDKTQRGRRVLNACADLAPVLLILDNVSACVAAGKAGFDPVVPYRVYSYLREVVAPHSGTAIALMHEAKGSLREGNREHAYLGSTGWNNAARARFAMSWDRDGSAVILKREKFNYGPKDQDGIRLVWRSGVWAREEDGGIVGSIRVRNDARVVVRILRELQRAGVRPSTSMYAPNNAFKAAEGRGLDFGDLTRQRFWKALHRAQTEGWVRQETITTTDRKQRDVWVVSEVEETEHAPTCANLEQA